MKPSEIDLKINRIIDVFAEKAKEYNLNTNTRKLFPTHEAILNLNKFNIELQDDPVNPEDANRLKDAGFVILNDVVLNQILVTFGDAELTNKIIRQIQDDGTCWCSGTTWQNHAAMRISISSWRTTREDVEKSADIIIAIAKEEIMKTVLQPVDRVLGVKAEGV